MNKLMKVRDLIRQEVKSSFLKHVDLYSIEDSVLIGVSGAMGRAFRVEGRDLLLQSSAEIEEYERRMRKFLNSLPDGVTLHFVIRSQAGNDEIINDYEDSIQVRNSFTDQFIQVKTNTYREQEFLKREVFLFVVIHPNHKPFSKFPFSDFTGTFGKKAHKLSLLEYRRAKSSLLRISAEVRGDLMDLGFSIQSLKKSELTQYLFNLLNPAYSNEFSEPHNTVFCTKSSELDPTTLRSRLSMSPPRVEYDALYLNSFIHKTINLLHLPEVTTLKSMKDFEQALGKEYLLSITLQVPDQEKEKADLKRQGNMAKARNFYSPSKDHEALAVVGESDEFLTAISESSDKLFYMSLSVMIKDRKEESLEQTTQNVLRAFRKLGGATGIVDHMNHDRNFLSFLPLQGDENPLSFLLHAESLVHYLPLQASWRGTEKVGLLLKTYRDEPLRFDLFDSKLQAKHAVMLGSSGAGKSFFMNHLLLHFLIESMEHEVIVIDLGGSYRKLASVLEGSYLEVECSEEYALNPFPAKRVLFPKGKDADATFLQFLKELLQQMINPSKVWPSSEKMILEKAIRIAYENLNEKDSPLLGDVGKCLRNYPLGDEEDRKTAYLFSKELTLFTEGEYGKLLNRPGVFDLDARFTVFDLRKISQYPELQEILLLIIPFALKRKFENLNLKKILVLDECWQLLKQGQGTDLIETFYRTARKLNAGVLSISQNPEDFLDSKIAGVMVNNSPVKYILRLKKGHEKLRLFGLNENEVLASEELVVKPGEYSEVFIKFDEKSVIARLKPNALEYWISTTDALDLKEEGKILNSEPFKNKLEILKHLAERFPKGVGRARREEVCA